MITNTINMMTTSGFDQLPSLASYRSNIFHTKDYMFLVDVIFFIEKKTKSTYEEYTIKQLK